LNLREGQKIRADKNGLSCGPRRNRIENPNGSKVIQDKSWRSSPESLEGKRANKSKQPGRRGVAFIENSGEQGRGATNYGLRLWGKSQTRLLSH